MAEKINRARNIVAVQFVHMLIFSYLFSIILGVFFQNTGGLAWVILWWMLPVFFIELLLLIKFKGKAWDMALPLVSIFVILLPVILQTISQSVSFDVIRNSIVFGATTVVVLNFYLLLRNFGRANSQLGSIALKRKR